MYEEIFPKKAKEIPVALGMALADAGLTTAAEIVARAKELAAVAEGAVDEKEKKEEGNSFMGKWRLWWKARWKTRRTRPNG